MNRTVAPIVGAAIVIGAAIVAVRDRAPSQPSAPVQTAPSTAAPASPDANELAALPAPTEPLASNVGHPEALPALKHVSTFARAVRPVATEASGCAIRIFVCPAGPIGDQCFTRADWPPSNVTTWTVTYRGQAQTFAAVNGEAFADFPMECSTAAGGYAYEGKPAGTKRAAFFTIKCMADATHACPQGTTF